MASTDAATSSYQKSDDPVVEYRRLYKVDMNACRTNHRNMGDDIRFFAEDQWLNEDRVEREAQNRPVVTEDHLAPAVRQITNDMRMNRPSIKIRGVDSEADPEVAKIFEGLIRNIEQQSFATSGNAYVRAGENAVICGQGAFRIISEYVNDSSFDQQLRIVPIRSALSVIWDSEAQSPTRDDAKRCWILTWMSHESFEKAYPGKAPDNWEKAAQVSQEWYQDWNKKDEVLVAEHFWKEPKSKTLWRLALDKRVIDVTDKDETERLEILNAQNDEAAEMGMPPPEPAYEEREKDGFEVWRVVLSGSDVLEEKRKWPGQHIPVINVMGEEIFLDESRTIRGLVRVGKDSQRMINYHNSAAIEHVSLSPKQPYLGTTAQFKNLTNEWQIANRQNAPFLRYNVDPKAPGPPTRAPAPEIPAALLTLKQEAVGGLQATTNVYPSSTGAQSNEISGVAIQKRDNQGDIANFHYVDNLQHSIGYCGRQLLDLIPKFYDGERIIRVIGEDDAEDMVEINLVDAETGEIKNDLSRGVYDLSWTTGPSFSTKRQEAAQFFQTFVQAASPEERAMTMDLLVKNLDIAGADELYERFRKLGIANGTVEPDPEKGEEPPPRDQGPSPEEIIAEAERIKAEADLINAQTKAAQNQTSALKNAADARKSFAESEGQQIENAADLMQLIQQTGAIEQAVSQQVAAVLPQLLEVARQGVLEAQQFSVETPINPNGGV